MNERAWQPLLVDDSANDARAIVDEVAAALAARPPVDLPGFKGDAATILLLAECDAPAAGPRLEHALLVGRSAPLTIAMYGGVTGLAWLVDQLAAGPEVDAVLEHFDAALTRKLDVERWPDRIDLLSGLAGAGVVFAARADARARQLAERVLAHFETSAIEIGPGVAWRTAPQFLPEAERAVFPDGMIDLGVAHGVPGIIGMLAHFVEAGIEPERSRALLGRAISWLLAAVPRECPRFGSSWPTDRAGKRIGWCYGDAGVASVLLRASRALSSQQLADEAVGLLRQSIPLVNERRTPDACFCHGAAGIAHIYNVAFQHTGELDLRDQAVRWLHEVIRMRSPGVGIAGYTSLSIAGSTPRRVDDATLLSGVVGTALVLLAAISESEPAWQRLFAL